MPDKTPREKSLRPREVTACTCANLRKAARVVSQAYDAALHPTGLKATQFTLLATLAKRGDMPLMKLAEALVLDRTTLTRNLRPLEAMGLVRGAQDEDRRVRRIGLTKAGARALEDALPLWRGAQGRLVATLGRKRWAGLLRDLEETIDAVRGG